MRLFLVLVALLLSACSAAPTTNSLASNTSNLQTEVSCDQYLDAHQQACLSTGAGTGYASVKEAERYCSCAVTQVFDSMACSDIQSVETQGEAARKALYDKLYSGCL